MKPLLIRFAVGVACWTSVGSTGFAADLSCTVSWLGNSFSGLILQWGNNLYRTEQKWPPNKPSGKASIWRDVNGDGDYQADEFSPNTDRVKPGPFCVDKKGNIWRTIT